jgi:hypothetical protein
LFGYATSAPPEYIPKAHHFWSKASFPSLSIRLVAIVVLTARTPLSCHKLRPRDEGTSAWGSSLALACTDTVAALGDWLINIDADY